MHQESETFLMANIIGDVEGIEMHEIDQIHFVPLPDVICNAVSKMNQDGRPVTLETLHEEIRKECPTVESPSTRTLRHAIQCLLKQEILESNLGQLYICVPPSAPYHSNKTPSKCTVECQTGESVVNGYGPSNSLKSRKGWLAFAL